MGERSGRRSNLSKGPSNGLPPDVDAPESTPGLRASDLLALPELQSGVLTWMMRQEMVSLVEVMAFLGQEEDRARRLLADLCDKGFVRAIKIQGVTHYRVRLASRRGRALPSSLWDALDEKTGQGREEQR
jgi:hypothetical protein